ncbi:DUF3253 domain-containing protein [Fulvivirga sp. M361]|uniref:DUF3253 domain-containing protein n=1 Tax=Fulvivirga sp. M361 TaxID=2594266 RepID=UPI00117B2FA7|nr:DUF3253 domain-containing protein [Fulvivirga sp. M361]TRX58699.1 DUF3253 domain-containing protein [Fulvivirga sp. M361]
MIEASKIKEVILSLAIERGKDKSFSLSEVARQLSPEHWKEQMDLVKLVAQEMVISGHIINAQSCQSFPHIYQAEESIHLKLNT